MEVHYPRAEDQEGTPAQYLEPFVPIQKRPNRWSIRMRLLPGLVFVGYLTLTVLLFEFGPWAYPLVDGTKLYTFLILAHTALFLGYLSGAFGRPGKYYGRWGPRSLVLLSLAVNAMVFFPTVIFRTGSIIPNVPGALNDLGGVYERSRELRFTGTPLIEYLRFLLGPLIYILLPLTIFYWKQLQFWVRASAVVMIVANLGLSIATGVNRDIAIPVVVGIWMILASHLSGVGRLRWSRRFALLVASAVAVGLFFLFFSTAIAARSSGLSARFFSPTKTFAEDDHLLLRYLPETSQIGMLGFTSYLTQGYYALYLSLDKPFVPTFGAGNSMFVNRQVVRLTGIDELATRSYPDRILIEDGWDSYHNYTTIYPWLASDVSFLGTIAVMFILGHFLALAWLDTLRGSNPFAVAMFATFVVMIFAFPTVNWVLNSGEGFSSFWVIILLWLFTRKKYILH